MIYIVTCKIFRKHAVEWNIFLETFLFRKHAHLQNTIKTVVFGKGSVQIILCMPFKTVRRSQSTADSMNILLIITTG